MKKVEWRDKGLSAAELTLLGTLGYQAQVRHGGKQLGLGNFATAKEAVPCVARVFSSSF